MNSIIDFISNNDAIVMISLFILIVVLLVVVIITDAINRRKNINDAKELLKDGGEDIINAFKENLNDEIDSSNTDDLEQYKDVLVVPDEKKYTEVTEIKYVEDDEELEKTKAQLELKNLKEELIKAEQREKEQLVKEQNIDKKEQIIDAFESSQEENAIISLDEFSKISGNIYEQNEEIQYKDEGNEPISIQELEELYNTKELKVINPIELENNIKNETNKVQENNSFKEESSKFKSSPIISPVFGIDTDEDLGNITLENTANLDKLSEEIRKTNEFLNTLKELRKNLQ